MKKELSKFELTAETEHTIMIKYRPSLTLDEINTILLHLPDIAYIKSYPTRARDAITGNLVHIYPNEQVRIIQPKEALL